MPCRKIRHQSLREHYSADRRSSRSINGGGADASNPAWEITSFAKSDFRNYINCCGAVPVQVRRTTRLRGYVPLPLLHLDVHTGTANVAWRRIGFSSNYRCCLSRKSRSPAIEGRAIQFSSGPNANSGATRVSNLSPASAERTRAAGNRPSVATSHVSSPTPCFSARVTAAKASSEPIIFKAADAAALSRVSLPLSLETKTLITSGGVS